MSNSSETSFSVNYPAEVEEGSEAENEAEAEAEEEEEAEAEEKEKEEAKAEEKEEAEAEAKAEEETEAEAKAEEETKAEAEAEEETKAEAEAEEETEAEAEAKAEEEAEAEAEAKAEEEAEAAVPVTIHHVDNDDSLDISTANTPHMPMPHPTVSEPMAIQPPAVASNTNNVRRPRGRPPGSRNRNRPAEFLGSSVTLSIPQVLTVIAGEDISSRIRRVSHDGLGALSVISASGSVSTAVLGLIAGSGGILTYEGYFDIVKLSGSYVISTEESGQRRRRGGLSISLAAYGGRLFGGPVAGLLIAASIVEIVLWDFNPDA